MAQVESSKPGPAAAGLEVIPTRQPFSRTKGEPRLPASKITSGVLSTLAGTGRAWVCGPKRPAIGLGGCGGGRLGECLHARCRWRKRPGLRTVRRKNPPRCGVFFTLIETGGSSKKKVRECGPGQIVLGRPSRTSRLAHRMNDREIEVSHPWQKNKNLPWMGHPIYSADLVGIGIIVSVCWRTGGY